MNKLVSTAAVAVTVALSTAGPAVASTTGLLTAGSGAKNAQLVAVPAMHTDNRSACTNLRADWSRAYSDTSNDNLTGAGRDFRYIGNDFAALGNMPAAKLSDAVGSLLTDVGQGATFTGRESRAVDTAITALGKAGRDACGSI